MASSKACCETPPIVAKGYEPKGKYVTVDGMKTYATGPSDASHAILVIYDIFGFFPQTIQAADIMATSDTTRKYSVFMPDWFEGKPFDIADFPPDTKEKEEKFGKFFSNQGHHPKTVQRIPKVLQEIQQSHPNIKSWGVIGYCWGGKAVNLIAQENTPFKAAVAGHPAFVDANDAAKITIPTLLIPSEGESEEDVGKWEKAMKAKYQINPYRDQVHGFMAARSDLENPKVKAAYEKAYQEVVQWFHDNM